MSTGPGEAVDPDQPDPHRIFPPGFATGIDPLTAAELGLADMDGVPIPFIVSSTRRTAQWLEAIEAGVTPDLIASITQGLAELEAQYPGSSVWDSQRDLLATLLAREEAIEPAIDLVFGMHSAHQQARSLMDVSFIADGEGESGPELSDVIFEHFLDRFEGSEGRDRLLRFIQAMLDESITRGLDDSVLDIYEGMLRTAIPGYEPVQAWAESMAEAHATVEWDQVLELLRDEDQWPGVPMRVRQRTWSMVNAMHASLVLQEASMDEMVPAMREALDEYRQRYPVAPAWDILTAQLALTAIEIGAPTATVDFGRAIQSPGVQQALIGALVAAGHEDEALALTLTLRDFERMASTLLASNWSDGRAREQLAGIIADETAPPAQRIAFLHAARDLFAANGEDEQAERWDREATHLIEQEAARLIEQLDDPDDERF